MSRFATIALLGPTNAGKSTFCNQILGTKISIVTPKVQTTRHAIRAIYTDKDAQLVFIDMPGIFHAKTQLEKWIHGHIEQGLAEADGFGALLRFRDRAAPRHAASGRGVPRRLAIGGQAYWPASHRFALFGAEPVQADVG